MNVGANGVTIENYIGKVIALYSFFYTKCIKRDSLCENYDL